MNRRERLVLASLGGVVAVLLLVLLIVSLAGGDGEEDEVAVASTTSSSFVTLLPTTALETTTTTTTARAPTTTTARPSTARPTTATTTATTAAPPATGRVVLEPDGLGVVGFGADPETTVSRLTARLGAPDEDSGYVDAFSQFGACPGKQVRGVRWGSLRVLFTDGDTAFGREGTRHFFTYHDTPFDFDGDPVESSGLETRRGVGIGFTVGELKAAYGNDLQIEEDEFGAHFSVRVPGRGALGGGLTGTGDDDTVELLTGGAGCGE